jgi:hypothetical protein
MIKFEYKPNVIDTPFGALDDPPPVESVTMTLGGDVSWDEAVCEFHNFLRAAGYVIPYDFEDDYVDCSDPPDMDKSGSLGDRQPEWANRMHGPDKRWHQSNTEVASEYESNTDVAPEMKPWAWLNDKEIDEIKQTAPAYVSAKAVNTVVDMVEEKLNQKYEWGDDA